MIKPSTFSIVAFDGDEPAVGVAVASKFPAVGAIVPWARTQSGAVATQAHANTSFGPHGLDLLAQGLSAQEALERLLSNDPQRESRQVGIVDMHGHAASFTGNECFDWAGSVSGNGFAIQGNILAGEQVVHAMAEAFQKSTGLLPDRLMLALRAGDQAGGDRRGRQSAAILVAKPQGGYGGFSDRWIDYRVDDDLDPVKRLSELLEMHNLYFGKSPVADRINLEGNLLKRLQDLMNRLGYYQGHSHGFWDEETRRAFRSFTGNENFEERCDPEAGWIDRPVFEFLMKRFGEQA